MNGIDIHLKKSYTQADWQVSPLAQFPRIPGYRIDKKFGRGAMGTVYLAFQKKRERHVALKVLLPSLSEDPETTQRFITEAKIGSQLQHSNIVSIYDVGKYGGYYYFAMEYLETSLKDFLKSFKDSRLNPEIALDILKQMANALDYAHKKGVIHRDIKPANILLRNDGTPVLVDFGIAKLIDSDSRLTKTGTSIGTPHYMSPEQIQGLEIDGRSDIYSLGVVFFEMLQGVPPYEGSDSIAIAVKHVKEPVPRLDRETEDFQSIIDGMMAKDKNLRFQSGGELNARIQEMQLDNLSLEKEDTIIRVRKEKSRDISITDEVPEQEYQRYRALKNLLLPIFVILVILGGGFGLWHLTQSQNGSEAALWKLAIEKESAEGYHQYLDEYPEGKQSDQARKMIAMLKKKQTTGVSPVEPIHQDSDDSRFARLIEQSHQALAGDRIKDAREFLQKARQIRETAETQSLEKKINERESSLRPRTPLRQQPRNLTIRDTQAMLTRLGFFDIQKTKSKKFNNRMSKKTSRGESLVVDRATGLMWHRSGSTHYMNFPKAKSWVSRLNSTRYAGYSDWRLPTLEEAASLLEPVKNSSGLYLDPLFAGKTRSIWTGDTLGNECWIVYFDHGYVDVNWPQFNSYVLPVRSQY